MSDPLEDQWNLEHTEIPLATVQLGVAETTLGRRMSVSITRADDGLTLMTFLGMEDLLQFHQGFTALVNDLQPEIMEWAHRHLSGPPPR